MGKIILTGLKAAAVFVGQSIAATVVVFGSLRAMDELEHQWNKYQYKRACKKADEKRKAEEAKKKPSKKSKKSNKNKKHSK